MYKLPHRKDTTDPVRFPITNAHQMPTSPALKTKANTITKIINHKLVNNLYCEACNERI